MGGKGKLLSRREGKCLLGELRGVREADRIRVSQHFAPAGAGETKDPHLSLSCGPPLSSNERNKMHRCPAPSTHPSKLYSRVAKGNCVPPSLMHLIRPAIVRPQISHACEPRQSARADDGQCDNSHLSPIESQLKPTPLLFVCFSAFFLRSRCCAAEERLR